MFVQTPLKVVMHIRFALPHDVPVLLNLIEEHAYFEKKKASITLEKLTKLVSASPAPAHMIVAEDKGVLLGYAAYTFHFGVWECSSFAYLDCLYIREEARGQGTGRKLMKMVLEQSKTAGVERVEWQTPDWNSDAIEFYRREGGIGEPKMRFGVAL